MIRLTVEGDEIVVRLSGWDRVWALRREVRAPLALVAEVRVDPTIARDPQGAQWPGTRIPGRVYAGTWLQRDGRAFWAVRDPTSALVVEFAGGPWRRWVLTVADRDVAVREITAGSRGSSERAPG